jgi:hypothetical protein
MTDRDASALQSQLDAMRMARAEDAKTCARLTARVKELEAEVSLVRGYLQEYQDTGRIAWNERPLAEGTRDEKAARCATCKVPCAVTSQHGMCAACDLERRCACPPAAPPYASTGTRCWQCGGRM